MSTGSEPPPRVSTSSAEERIASSLDSIRRMFAVLIFLAVIGIIGAAILAIIGIVVIHDLQPRTEVGPLSVVSLAATPAI